MRHGLKGSAKVNGLKKSCAGALALILLMAGCAHYGLTPEQRKALAEILEILNTTISETETVISRKPDPTSPFRDFAKKLETIRGQIGRMESGETDYDPEAVERYWNDIIEIRLNVNQPVDRVLSVDVFFGPGKYKVADFSEEGKRVLDEFAADIIRLQVDPLRKLFPEKRLAIVIKAIGYADAAPLADWFAEKLADGLSGPAPDDPVERRKRLNQVLSYRRAEAIAGYVRMRLREMLEMEKVVIEEPIILGLGEAYPYPEETVHPPYEEKDKRRRICKIHGNVFVAAP
jgi:outer membrane protein OmpA-like peptidoglycan-associated protein